MADRTLYPYPASHAVLIPASVEDAAPHVRAWLAQNPAIDPVYANAYWEMLPGTGEYCAMIDYRESNPGPPSMLWAKSLDPLDLAKYLANIYFGKRVYALILVENYKRAIEAYERNEDYWKDWCWFELSDLRKAERGMPTDPWDFAAWKGVTIERPPPRLPPPPVRSVSLVENATIEELEPLKGKRQVSFHPAPSGVYLTGKGSADLAIVIAFDLRKPVYLIKLRPTRAEFYCDVFLDGGMRGRYQSPPSRHSEPVLDSIRGETTLPGILRALGIPFELAGLAPDGTILPDAP